jgi:hypothetical protein
LYSSRRKFGLVNFVSLLPDFGYDSWRLCQSKKKHSAWVQQSLLGVLLQYYLCPNGRGRR